MRQIRVRLSLPDGDLHDWGGAYGQADFCPLEAYRMEVLADGTVTAVVAFEGDPDLVRDRLRGDESVYRAAVTDHRDGLFHVRFEPRPVVREMLEMRRETSVVMGLPMQLNADGSATARFYGHEGEFTEILEYMPGTVDVEIRHLGDVAGTDRSVFDRLTERQREVLDAAVDAGYYEDPRGTTHAALAAELDVSPTTISEHLRRIERRVFAAYADEP